MRILTMVPRNIVQGEINNWEPKDIQEAKLMIEHLQKTIQFKDNRILATLRENKMLLDRIFELKQLLESIGIKVA